MIKVFGGEAEKQVHILNFTVAICWNYGMYGECAHTRQYHYSIELQRKLKVARKRIHYIFC